MLLCYKVMLNFCYLDAYVDDYVDGYVDILMIMLMDMLLFVHVDGCIY